MPHTRKEIIAIGQEVANKIFHKKEVEKVTIEGWVTKDKNTEVAFWKTKPEKCEEESRWFVPGACLHMFLGFDKRFSSVQWSDPEPRKAKITIEL